MLKVLVVLVAVIASSLTSLYDAIASPAGQIEHYAYYSRDRDKMPVSPALTNSWVSGAQIMYAWRSLEPRKGIYDFSEIREDIAILAQHEKKLFIQLQDSTFTVAFKAVPDYLINQPQYNGGVAPQFNEGKQEGWAARRWDPMVGERFHLLLNELGREFDGVIAGINLQETAIVLDEKRTKPEGFTYEKYRDAIKANMTALKAAFPKSIKMQYANFMPGEWLPWNDNSYLRDIYLHAKSIGIAVGSPDLMPKRKGQQNHAYRLMREHNDQLLLGIAVQDGNYHEETGGDEIPDRPLPNIVPDLYKFAKDELKVRVIFWVTQEPYFSQQVLPFLETITRR